MYNVLNIDVLTFGNLFICSFCVLLFFSGTWSLWTLGYHAVTQLGPFYSPAQVLPDKEEVTHTRIHAGAKNAPNSICCHQDTLYNERLCGQFVYVIVWYWAISEWDADAWHHNHLLGRLPTDTASRHRAPTPRADSAVCSVASRPNISTTC